MKLPYTLYKVFVYIHIYTETSSSLWFSREIYTLPYKSLTMTQQNRVDQVISLEQMCRDLEMIQHMPLLSQLLCNDATSRILLPPSPLFFLTHDTSSPTHRGLGSI